MDNHRTISRSSNSVPWTSVTPVLQFLFGPQNPL
jgi:hypothetical protein